MSPAHLQPALDTLRQSLEYAAHLERDPWDFAVEIAALRALGLTNSDLRWLLCKGWVRHAAETTRPSADGRSFAPLGPLVLTDGCCFVLDPAGAAAQSGVPVCTAAPAGPVVPGAVPCWDRDRRVLRFGDRVVKQFKVPAPNQEVVLVTFQEEAWSVRIDDPLPAVPALDPKRRLHDTINSLNRNQRVPLLRFYGDGSGESVCWEPIAAR